MLTKRQFERRYHDFMAEAQPNQLYNKWTLQSLWVLYKRDADDPRWNPFHWYLANLQAVKSPEEGI